MVAAVEEAGGEEDEDMVNVFVLCTSRGQMPEGCEEIRIE